MLKMYNSGGAHSGSSPDFWESNWEASAFEDSARFMSVDPLRPLFEENLRPDSLMLEGGCGMGNYVAYYADRGYKVVGLDFAQKALKTLNKRQPGLQLAGGDVSNLPFPDKVFDLYYSGGVVEHFEGGAEQSLREARRVLKDDGTLLISVPYFNPLRRVLARFRTENWRVISSAKVDGDEVTSDKKFFQYAYTTGEFKSMLADAGLRTIKTKGYAVLWGLQEIPLLNREGRRETGAENTSALIKKDISISDSKELFEDKPISLAKRLMVSEDDKVPVLGLGVKVMTWAVGNMMMYVCRRAN